MHHDFPELTTIGALFRFASRLEETACAVLEQAAGTAGDAAAADQLRRLATKHRRRAEEVDLARREKLNETVLEPLMDMPNEPYVPALTGDLETADGAALLRASLDVEARSARFYADAVSKAGQVLGEVRRLFARFEKESAKNVTALQGLQ
jgi:hypothetical protein